MAKCELYLSDSDLYKIFKLSDRIGLLCQINPGWLISSCRIILSCLVIVLIKQGLKEALIDSKSASFYEDCRMI